MKIAIIGAGLGGLKVQQGVVYVQQNDGVSHGPPPSFFVIPSVFSRLCA